jgi:hypothetical protein
MDSKKKIEISQKLHEDLMSALRTVVEKEKFNSTEELFQIVSPVLSLFMLSLAQLFLSLDGKDDILRIIDEFYLNAKMMKEMQNESNH